MCVAIPGRITWIGAPSAASTPARAEFPGGEREIDLVMVPDAQVGDHVLVHSGYAIRVVSSDQAAATLELLGSLKD